MLARGGWRLQRDGLEAGGTGTMLLDSKILARLAGADERLFHRTLSLRRRPATTRTRSTTTIAVPIWVRSLHSTLSRPPFSLVLVISPLHPVEFLSPTLSFASHASFASPSPQTAGDGTCLRNFRLFLPVKGILPISRRFLYIFSIASPNNGAEIDFALIFPRRGVFRDGRRRKFSERLRARARGRL